MCPSVFDHDRVGKIETAAANIAVESVSPMHKTLGDSFLHQVKHKEDVEIMFSPFFST